VESVAAKDDDAEGHGRPASAERPEPGQVLEGTVAETDGRRLVVDLPGGHRGVARLAESHRASAGDPGPGAGAAVRVKVLGMTAESEFRLEWLPPDAAMLDGMAFDEEMDRLTDALRRRSPGSGSTRNTHNGPALERRMASWMNEVERGLERLRAHRGERLSREFYDEGEDGGARAEGRRDR
jgi:hypothetical protein